MSKPDSFGANQIGLNSISSVITGGMDRVGLKGMDALPLVPTTLLRKVKQQEFETYLKSLSDVMDRYTYNTHMGIQVATEGTPILGNQNEPNEAEEMLRKLLDNAKQAQNTIATKQYKVEKKLHNRMFSGNVPQIDTIPTIFFDPNFNLCNPHTFEIVCSTTESIADSTVLQEKLGHYLDTVEIYLIREISRRSASFFAALSNLQALLYETQDCVQKINLNRRLLNHLLKSVALDSLQVSKLKRRRGNLVSGYGGAKLVSEITQTLPMIQSLLTQGDFVGSLDLIAETSMLLRGNDKPDSETKITSLTDRIKLISHSSIIPRNLDLRGVSSLVNLNGKMNDMIKLIGSMMETEFVNVILADLDAIPGAIPDVKSYPANQRASLPLPHPNSPAAGWMRNILSNNFSFQSNALPATPIEALPMEWDENLKNKLHPLVLGLLRMDRLGSALQLYKDTLLQRIKMFSKKFYPSSLTHDDEKSASNTATSPNQASKFEAQSNLAKNLRAMPFESFADLLIMLYMTLLYTLQKVSVIHISISKIVGEAQIRGVIIGAENIKSSTTNSSGELDVTVKPRPVVISAVEEFDDDLGSLDLLSSNSPLGSGIGMHSKDLNNLDNDLNEKKQGATSFAEMIANSADIVFSASDLAHMRCSKLIGVRSEQNSQLHPSEFYRLFGATWEFVSGGEALNGRMCFGLKSTMLSQAKAFLNFFHEEKSKQIALLIENEQWIQAEVPIDFQVIVERLLGSSQLILTAGASSVPLSRDDPGYDQPTDNANDSETDLTSMPIASANASNDGTTSLQYLTVDGQKFYAVGCLLMFLKMISEYMACIDNIPGLTNDVLNRILEVLKLFNSRICQVILGAGAMRSAGLKNITARHIALASQSLGIVVQIIPHLRNTISKRLPIKQQVLLTDFDRLMRDYREHQNELYFKLVTIMQERLLSINWDAPEDKDLSKEEGVSVYMAMLVKETSTLFRVLAKYLPKETLKKIMLEVFKAYTVKLEEELKKLDLFSSTGKNRLLIDIQYYIDRLSALEGIDGPGNHMEVVVNNIKIKDKRSILASTNIRSSASLDFGSSGSLAGGRTSVSSNQSLDTKNLHVAPDKSHVPPTPASNAPRKFNSMFSKFTTSRTSEDC